MTDTPIDPLDVAQEARFNVEAHAIEVDHLENRVIRIEEIIAARWPRSLLLRRRLAREIRASVSFYDEEYIPKADFAARRSETVWEQIGDDPHREQWVRAMEQLPHIRDRRGHRPASD